MILEPVVENSLQHGIRENLSEGYIKLVIKDEEKFISISVLDNGAGMDEETVKKIMGSVKLDHDDDSTGIGLDNVFSRLKLYFGDTVIYDIKSNGPGTGTEIIIKVPKMGG